MSVVEWVVCEPTNRWSAALRLLLDDQTEADRCRFRIREVRSLAELSAILRERVACLACIETRRDNLRDILTWLSTASHNNLHVKFAALIDYSLHPDPWASPQNRSSLLQDASDALREAGAATVVTSPRRLGPLLEFGRQIALNSLRQPAANDGMTIAAKVWAALPWQAR
jgi:hypothetical protein